MVLFGKSLKHKEFNMRCLVNGELVTDKVNTSLITIYKAIEDLESSIKNINSTLSKLDARITALEQSNNEGE